MMKTKFPKNVNIRTAIVRDSRTGYIFAGDPKREKEEIAHAIFFKWNAGNFTEGSAKYNAHTCCLISDPEFGLVRLSGSGTYGITTQNKKLADNIFNKSRPKPQKDRYGDIRSVTTIGEKAHAVGLGGMVYRLDDLETWTRIDEGLPESFDIEAIDGFNEDDLYTVGYKGQLWHFTGMEWHHISLPTKEILGCVKCTDDRTVYIAGNKGTLVRGKGNTWEIVHQKVVNDTIWGMECFNETLYVSTMSNVYYLDGDQLIPVDFGDDPPRTCYQLSAAEDVMWSVGAKDILSFDGKKWTRIV